MGLFDTLAGTLLGGSGTAPNQLVDTVLNLINDNKTGGLTGFIKAFTERGLGDAISSWVGTGENQPVSGDQIMNALGSEQIASIARKLGIGEQDAANGLAGLLPSLIDKLTPQGQVPEGDLLAHGIELLKGKLLG